MFAVGLSLLGVRPRWGAKNSQRRIAGRSGLDLRYSESRCGAKGGASPRELFWEQAASRLTHRGSDIVTVHVVDGLQLRVDRGPNWLIVKLRPDDDSGTKIPPK